MCIFFIRTLVTEVLPNMFPLISENDQKCCKCGIDIDELKLLSASCGVWCREACEKTVAEEECG